MLYAIDFETVLIQPGLPSPPPVCMSVASNQGVEIFEPSEALEIIEFVLQSDTIIGANTAFDMAIACNARPSLVPAVFAAYDDDRIMDVLIRQKLIDIAMGEYRHHGRYNLAALTKRLCGRELKKEDTWRC